MSNDSSTLEVVAYDLGLSFQDRIEILFNEIELAARWDRPSILFAIYKSGLIRDDASSILSGKLNQIGQKTHYVTTSVNDHFDFLSQISQLPDLPQTVLLIDGFNWECGTEGVSVFKEFNKYREYFIDNNIRAIFWLFEKEVSDFATNAMECWILRHRVVEFMDLPQNDRGSIQSNDSPCQAQENPIMVEKVNSDSNRGKNEPSKVENKNASHAKGLLNLGLLFWRKQNTTRAFKYLHESIQICQSLGDNDFQSQGHNALALIHSELGNTEEAISSFRNAITLAPESSKLWNALGQLLSKCEKNEEAIQAYKNATSCSPQDYLSWEGIGYVYIKLGEFQNAISAFEKALAISPNYASAWAGKGDAYLKSEQLEKAESSLRKAVELNTHQLAAWSNLGRCLHKQIRDLDAFAVFQKALEINPQSAELWDELGMLQLERRCFTESISAFQKAISFNPARNETRIRLAHAFFQIGDYESAASLYEETIPLFEDDMSRAALWDRLGDTYLYMKDYEKTIEAYKKSEQMLNEHPKCNDINAEAPYGIEVIKSSNEQNSFPGNSEKDRGEKMIEANQLYDLKTAAEWNEHGNTQLKAGEYNDAIVAFTKAIELAPDTCWPYIQNLAQVHYLKGKAKGKLNNGKKDDPDVWESDDETDLTSIASIYGDTNLQPGNYPEESKLEKGDINNLPSLPSAVNDPGNVNIKFTEVIKNNSTGNGENNNDTEGKQLVIEENRNNKDQKKEKNGNVTDIQVTPLATQLPPDSIQKSSELNELGNTLTNEQKFENAIKAYKTAIEANPKNGQPYSNLGYIYYRLGKYDFAILLFKKSINLLETQADKALSWNRLGDAYRRLGDYGNAMTAYKKSSEMSPSTNRVMDRARVSLLDNLVAG